jgi:hypothetical protein
MLERQMNTGTHDLFVRAPKREMKESQWIEDRMRRLPKRVDQHLLRDRGGPSAIGMAAHSIDYEQQGCVLVDSGNGFVLVLFTRPEKADVRVLDLQGGTRALLDWPRLYHARPPTFP